MAELNTNTTYDWFIQSISEVSKTSVGKKLKIELGCVQQDFKLIEHYDVTKGDTVGDRLKELITKTELVKLGESIKPDPRAYLKKGMRFKGKLIRRWIESKGEYCVFELNYDSIKPESDEGDLSSIKAPKKIQFTPKDLHNLRKVTMMCNTKDDAREKVLSTAPELEKAFTHFIDSGELAFE